ncbi:HBR098Cp [Eremothecium sinecaudum]|uniref:HBR098Cp n=1 Tax=Eremothecium sinecaudum TaxID=45286 RepID=A0A109UWW0_9SACH|nr:HBR098Cp [Eremothecium sinecaudum]AMD18999.1 HBR098Cp [Eremothecium sinecaudum]
MSDLIVLQRDYIISCLNSIRTDNGIKFLVIDSLVDELFNYLFVERNELLSHVTAVDLIDSRSRVGKPSVDVIYMISATKFNISSIEADFSTSPTRYRRHHIRFMPGFTPELAYYLKSKRYVSQYMASLSEIKCSFIPKAHNFFETMGIDQSTQIFFNPQCKDLIEQAIQKTVQSLLNICIVTGEYPIVRYSEPNRDVLEVCRATVLAKRLAFEFQSALDDYARQNEDFPPSNPRPRSVLIITDRCLDLMSPLVHDFSYQCMAYDLVNDLDLRTAVYRYEAENERGEMEKKSSKLLDLVDPDWVELKHQHIADASEALNEKINDMISKNPLLVDRSKVKTTTDLLSVVAHLKDFDEVRRRITLHKKLIDQCLELSKQRGLVELSYMEQSLCGYGIDFEGNKVKQLAEELVTMLAEDAPSITDKIRYMIEYAMLKGGLIESDFAKLLAFIGIEKDHGYFQHFMILFKNFRYLGFKLVKADVKAAPFEKEWMHDTVTNDPNIYQTSRFVPALANILSSTITNPLLVSEASFPYVKDKPIELLDPESGTSLAASSYTSSLRNPRHKASWAKTNSQSKLPKQRFFYYIIGGITNIELKAAYSQAQLKNKDIFIGSDAVLTPLKFMQTVEKLSESRARLKLQYDEPVPSAIPENLAHQRPLVPEQTEERPNTQPNVHRVNPKSTGEEMGHTSITPTQTVSNETPLEHVNEKEKRRHKFKKFLRK